MDLSRLKLSDEAVDSVYALMLKVEVIDKKRIRAAKSFEALIELLCHACDSNEDQIQYALNKLVGCLSEDQLSVLNMLGATLPVTNQSISREKPLTASTQVYRGQVVERAATTSESGHCNETNKGKKRVIYRGRETWV